MRKLFLVLVMVFSIGNVSAEYKRVIALTPALAELAMAVGLPEGNIVGVSEYTDFPAVLKSKPSIGPFTKPSLEKIVTLNPDLLLVSGDGTPREVIERLRKLKVPLLVLKTDSLKAVEEAYLALGKAFAQEVQAKLALDELKKKTEALKARAKERSLSVVIQVGEDPLVVAGGENFLSEGLALLGLRNAYGDAKHTYPRISVEDVLKRNPDIILILSLGVGDRVFEKAKKRWSGFTELKAAKEKRIFIVKSDALVRPGPRLPDGLSEVEDVVFGKVGH